MLEVIWGTTLRVTKGYEEFRLIMAQWVGILRFVTTPLPVQNMASSGEP